MSDRLPDDIQRLVLDKVLSPRDHARFSCACKLWYSIYKERTFPWFVLTDHDNENHTRGFFSVYDQKIYRINAPELEESYTLFSHGFKQIRGSSHGWLVTIDNKYDFGLYNPFSKTFIQLPPPIPFGKPVWDSCRTRRVILSCNPCTNPNECTIMLLDYHGNLAYCKLGDKSWAPISSEIDGIFDYFQDVIFYKGNFVVVCRSQMFICHIGPEPHFTPFGPKMSMTHYIYLVNLQGDVVIVDRYDPAFRTDSEDGEDDNDGQNKQNDNGYLIQDEQNNTVEDSNEDEDFVTRHFDVYKLDKDMTSWRKENEIGDRILFLGFNDSIFISTSLVPNSIANTIYYGDGLFDNAIFHLKKTKKYRAIS